MQTVPHTVPKNWFFVMQDILSDILQTLRLRGSFYFRLGFSAPFGVEVPAYKQSARFHLVVQGNCVVRLANGQALSMASGDLVLIPRGQSHCILDSAESNYAPLEHVLENAGYRGEGVVVATPAPHAATNELVCGHFTFRDGASHPILQFLPDAIVITAAMRAGFGWLDDIVRMMTRRVFESRSTPHDQGMVAIVQRLAEVMFVEILRAGLSQSPEMQRVIGAFSDERIGKTLMLIHTHPEKPWTVESLAKEIGMSRARFADQFTERVGEGPVSYLRGWRLQRAAALLDDTRLNVQQIAAKVGYESTAAFSRAFSQRFGIAPSEYRSEVA